MSQLMNGPLHMYRYVQFCHQYVKLCVLIAYDCYNILKFSFMNCSGNVSILTHFSSNFCTLYI